MNFLAKMQAKHLITAKPKAAKPSAVKKQEHDDLDRINNEYYPFPDAILSALRTKRMLYIYSHDSDIADMAVGGGDFTRGVITETVGDNYIVVKPDTPTFLRSKKKIAKGEHITIGVAGFKKGVARAFVDKAENGLLYIGSMSGYLIDF